MSGRAVAQNQSESTGVGALLRRWVPGIELARSYERSWLSNDLAAGLSLTALLVPQGMAYAELAGLPAVTGLYTTVVALIAYALLGPSRILVLGPDSALGPLIFAAVGAVVLVADDPAEAVATAGVLALFMGLISMAAGMTGLGRIAELLSKPARIGYLNGLAVVIFFGQLPKLFGFSTEANGLWAEAEAFVRGLADGAAEPAAAVIGVGVIIVILGLRRVAPRMPGVLVATVGAIAVVAVFGLAGEIAVVGSLPTGFPSPSLPSAPTDQLARLFAAALGLAFVSLADTMALSRSLAADRGDDVDPDDELVALGGANIAAAFFQGFPVSASSSRTLVAESARARTQVTGLVGAAAILGILAWGSGLLKDMPSSALAAIVMTAALSLLDLQALRWLWRVRRSEFVLALIAFLGVALVGVLEGIVVAVLLSLGNFIRRAWRPHDAILGRIEGQKGYHDTDRNGGAETIPGLVIFRFDAPLFFANADHFRRRVREAIEAAEVPVEWLMIAAEPITDIDTTGAEALAGVLGELDTDGIIVGVAEMSGPVSDRLRRYGLYERIGDEHFYPTLGRAIDDFVTATGSDWVDWSDRP
jgi:high affinity sulfate transporter 1